MTKLEQVIYGLDCCSWCIKCSFCPYKDEPECKTVLMCDALELLKKQEPRVMTLEEVEKTDEWMWAEYVTGYCGWQRTDEEDDYLNMVAWNDNTVDRKDYYRKTWRCWSSRPSEQQIRDTPWEGDSDAK